LRKGEIWGRLGSDYKVSGEMTAPGEQIVAFYKGLRESNQREHDRILMDIFREGLAAPILQKYITDGCEQLKKSTDQRISIVLRFSLKPLYTAGSAMEWKFYILNEAGAILDFSSLSINDKLSAYYEAECTVSRFAMAHIKELFPGWEAGAWAILMSEGFPELRTVIMRRLI
jgi:hypothetical protein